MNKTIHIDLTVGSINQAVRQLEAYEKSVSRRTETLVNELVDGGAELAQWAFRGWGLVDKISEGGTGIIEATGENLIIAEFGAGMATMEGHPLKNNAPVDVYRGSYSEQVGSGEFYLSYQETGHGFWHFGGSLYSAVEPKHGMLDARDYVVNNVESKARKVFG